MRRSALGQTFPWNSFSSPVQAVMHRSLETSPQKRASPHCLRDPLSGRFEVANDSAVTLQSCRGPPRLLFLSAPQNFHKRTSFRVSWQSQRRLHQGSKGHSGEGLPWRLRCLEISLETMYRRRRSLFWNLLMRSLADPAERTVIEYSDRSMT